MVKPQTTAGCFLAVFLLLTSAATTASAQWTEMPPAAVERQHGIELYRKGKFPEASKVLRKAVKKDRADEEGWYYLGLSLLRQPKEIKEASKAFETALKLRPNFAPAHVGLSYSLLLRYKSPESVRAAQAALSIDSNIAEAHYIIGVARLRAGAQEDALQQAETAIKLNPEFAVAYLLKSQALASSLGDVVYQKESESTEARKARFALAADALEKYLQLEPNTTDKQTWTEQLESLRFYLASHQKPKGNDDVFSGKDVTMKARVLAKPEPAYTESARQAQIVGTVVLRAVFDSDGTVKHFLVVKGLPYGLTEASVKAARKIRFIPASIDGRPVSTFIQLEYNFNLY